MNKLIIAAAVMSVAPLVRSADAEAPVVEEEEAAWFEAGFDYDFLSAYVWRNAVQNDEMVMQPCVWADLTRFEPFWLGFSIWQNYDLTDRRHSIYQYGLNETDYNVHVGATAWESEDENYSLGFELGHEWYTYQGVRDGEGNGYPNTREIYLKATFDNPFVGVYGQASWMYEDFGDYLQGMHYELGFTKEVEIVDTLTLGADWNLNFGDMRYLGYLYGGEPANGFGGTTFKVYLTWQITEWLSLGGVVGYTGVLNGSLRDSIGDEGDDYWFCGNAGENYPRDLFWGGLQLRLTY